MPTYSVYTKITSNVPTENLRYDLANYQMDSVRKNTFYSLRFLNRSFNLIMKHNIIKLLKLMIR